MASTNTTSLGYIAEVTAGTTPSTPAWQLLPVTSNNLLSNLTTAESVAIRDDRQLDDLVITDNSVSGAVGMELSYTPYKPWLLSLMQNSTTSAIAITAGTAVGATSKINKVGIESLVTEGATVRLASSAESDIDGDYIVTLIETDNITVTPALPIAAAAVDVTVDVTTRITNGASTPDNYSIRTVLKNTAGTEYFKYVRGAQIASASLNFATGALIDGSFDIMSLTETATSSAIAGETEVAIPSYSVMSGASSVGTISVEGLTVGTCSFSNLSLSINNQINEAKSLGTLGACALSSFSLQATGDATFYFEDLTAYSTFLASTSFRVSFNVIDGDGNTIGFNFPKCKWSALSAPVSGKDSFLEESGSFTALRDTTSDAMVELYFIDA